MLFALALMALFSGAPVANPAPPIVSNTWINSAPIRPADLKGRVVHTPETDAEREVGNVRAAIAMQRIVFPVALDNDFGIWKSFGNQYWPAIYLVDARGAIRFTHIGELHVGTNDWRDLTRRIDALLREAPPS